MQGDSRLKMESNSLRRTANIQHRTSNTEHRTFNEDRERLAGIAAERDRRSPHQIAPLRRYGLHEWNACFILIHIRQE